MNNFGLYAVDATQDNYLKGYRDPTLNDVIGIANANEIYVTKWRRTKLFYNGKECNNTVKETNGIGFYAAGKRLICNGDDVATSSSALPSLSPVKFEEHSISFGDATIGAVSECINITLDDYENLRGFKEVPGYTRYNPFAVYNIVANVASSPKKSVIVPDEVEDMTYQSLVYKQAGDAAYLKSGSYIIDADNALSHNILGEKDFTSGLIPELNVRHVTSNIKAGEYIEFEYFVDTKYYDSVHKRRISRTVTVGGVETKRLNTFTLIVTTSEGVEVYKNTTYAGQYKVAICPYTKDENDSNPDIGEHWLSFKVIDDEGRGSIEYFCDIVVNKVNPNIKELEVADLTHYKIVLNSGRENLNQGYFNKKGLETLFNDLASGTFKPVAGTVQNGVTYDGNTADGIHYDGVKLPNKASYKKDLTDAQNDIYFIDNHNITSESTVNGVQVANIPKFSNYYLLFYKKEGDTVQLGKLNNDGTFTPIITNGNTYYTASSGVYTINQATLTALASCELKPGATIDVQLINPETGTEYFKSITIPSNTSGKADCDYIFDWIYDDGANIYRENNVYGGRICRRWKHNLDNETEVCLSQDKTARAHRIRSFNIALKNCADSKLANSFFDAIESDDVSFGYFYLSFFDGPCVENGAGIFTAYGETNYISNQRYLSFPDDFIVDFNYAKVQSTDMTDVTHKIHLICLHGVHNTHIKNVNIQGDYDNTKINIGYLKSCAINNDGIWQRGGSVAASATRCCSVNNVEIHNDCGFGFSCGSIVPTGHSYKIGTIDATSSPYPIQFDTIGYINHSNVEVSYTDDVYYTADNEDNISDAEESRLETLGKHVCLLTTSSFIDIYNTADEDYNEAQNNTYTTRHKIHLRYTRKNGKEYILTPYDWGFYIQSFANSVYGYAAGLHHAFFIYCYNEDDELIKIVKAKQTSIIKLPNTTVKIKITAYGLCSKSGNTASIDYNSSYPNVLASGLEKIVLRTTPYPSGLVLSNATIHDTRTSAVTGTSYNGLIKNCKFYNIGHIPVGYNLTHYVLYVEENPLMSESLSVINCEVEYDERDALDRNMNAPSFTCCYCATPVYFKNCKGFSFYNSEMNRSAFIDCKFAGIKLCHSIAYWNNYQNIFKRTVISGRTKHQNVEILYSDRQAELNQGKTYIDWKGRESDEKTSNVCKEPVFDCCTFDQCIIAPITKGQGSRILSTYNKYNTIVDNLNKSNPYTLEDSYERQEETINN